jgi:hypothetical protein
MISVCLGVFAAIVIADYYVQRKAVSEAVAVVTPTPALVASPSQTPTSTPSPKASPSPKPEDDLEAGLVPTPDPYDEIVAAAREKRRPSPTPNIDDYLDKLPAATSTPTPVPRPSVSPPQRTESVVSAFDILSIHYGKSQDSRRYRFRLDGIARVKGSFDASGGGVIVRIISGGSTYYSSGYEEVSADKIDVALYPGTYEVEVNLASRGVVSFHVNLTAYYNP